MLPFQQKAAKHTSLTMAKLFQAINTRVDTEYICFCAAEVGEWFSLGEDKVKL